MARSSFQRGEAIYAGGGPAEQLLADFNGLRPDRLGENRQCALPGVLGQAVGPIAPEHQAGRAEQRQRALNVWTGLVEHRQATQLAVDVWKRRGELDMARP